MISHKNMDLFQFSPIYKIEALVLGIVKFLHIEENKIQTKAQEKFENKKTK